MRAEAAPEDTCLPEPPPAGDEGQVRPELAARRQVRLEDGRYLIYYTFTDRPASSPSQ